ncbi:MAG: histidine phosphatase family protein [Alphaproteobacteria bacterium]|nr:histidine phosphatase family protein [Rhodospirillales bacterium]MCW9046279.1 histidine phosphatase family protein [Alphaproteobacteria bacterium]
MTKTIYLLRHAKSDWGNPALGDHDRVLNGRGVEAANLMGEMIEKEKFIPDVILCSSAARTRETLDLVQAKLSKQPPVFFDEALYLASPALMLNFFHNLSDEFNSAMMIAHNPGTEELATALTAFGSPVARMSLANKYPTAALSIIFAEINNWADLKTDCNRLAAFIRPKYIEQDLLTGMFS